MTDYNRIATRAWTHRNELRQAGTIATCAALVRHLFTEYDATGTYPPGIGPVHVEALLHIIEAAADSLHHRLVDIVCEEDQNMESEQ